MNHFLIPNEKESDPWIHADFLGKNLENSTFSILKKNLKNLKFHPVMAVRTLVILLFVLFWRAQQIGIFANVFELGLFMCYTLVHHCSKETCLYTLSTASHHVKFVLCESSIAIRSSTETVRLGYYWYHHKVIVMTLCHKACHISDIAQPVRNLWNDKTVMVCYTDKQLAWRLGWCCSLDFITP